MEVEVEVEVEEEVEGVEEEVEVVSEAEDMSQRKPSRAWGNTRRGSAPGCSSSLISSRGNGPWRGEDNEGRR